MRPGTSRAARTLLSLCAALVGCATPAPQPTAEQSPSPATETDAAVPPAGPAPAIPSMPPELPSLAVAGFNLQSSDSDEQAMADQLATLRPADLWGLAEVDAQAGPNLEAALESRTGRDYTLAMGTTGGRPYRLCVAYDGARFELLQTVELFQVGGRTGRAPLALQLRDRTTGQDLWFMVNHLQRGDDAMRLSQARQLRAWAERQALPIIAVGDYNFDWRLADGDREHDPAYDALTDGDVFAWLRPEALFPTHCSGFQSVLDFIFLAGPAKDWPGRSYVLDTERPCFDTPERSDHRPVWATLTPAAVSPRR